VIGDGGVNTAKQGGFYMKTGFKIGYAPTRRFVFSKKDAYKFKSLSREEMWTWYTFYQGFQRFKNQTLSHVRRYCKLICVNSSYDPKDLPYRKGFRRTLLAPTS
jgi:hypothetical protein